MLDRFPGARRSRARATSRRSRSSRRRPTASAATPCCRATSSAPTTAPGSCTPRSRSARTTSASASSTGSRSSTRCAPDGTYDERIGPYAGRSVKDADPDLIADLEQRGRAAARRAVRALLSALLALRHAAALLREGELVHPHDRGARRAARARTRTIDWYPVHIKHGRFGKWLENNVDWALSRDRYWGTPLPVWRCEQGHDALRRLGRGARASWPARAARGPAPAVHRRGHASPARSAASEMRARAGGDRRLVRLRLDAVRAVPLPVRERGAVRAAASRPTSSARRSTRRAAGSTRCSRSRRSCSAARSYQNVLCLGLILDPEGQKMSKSRGNVVAPWDVIDRHGADAFRWYYFTSQQPWSGYRFSLETVGESVRKFLLTLWNTYRFYVLYANVDGFDHDGARRCRRPSGPTSTAGSSRAFRARSRPCARSSTPTTRRPPGARSRRSSTTSRTGTCAAAAGASGARRRSDGASASDKLAAYLTLHESLVDGREAARAVHALRRRRDLHQPRRRPRRRCTCATSPSPTRRSSTASSSSTWRSRAARSSSAAPRAARPR